MGRSVLEEGGSREAFTEAGGRGLSESFFSQIYSD
jgi:hypothetical protein